MGPRYGALCVPPLLFALFLGTFAIGTTEFAIVGLLPDIAESLGVSVSSTGLLVSGYALGVAVGGPAVVATTTSQSRQRRFLGAKSKIRASICLPGHAESDPFDLCWIDQALSSAQTFWTRADSKGSEFASAVRVRSRAFNSPSAWIG
jgi:MFS family permease